MKRIKRWLLWPLRALVRAAIGDDLKSIERQLTWIDNDQEWIHGQLFELMHENYLLNEDVLELSRQVDENHSFHSIPPDDFVADLY